MIDVVLFCVNSNLLQVAFSFIESGPTHENQITLLSSSHLIG